MANKTFAPLLKSVRSLLILLVLALTAKPAFAWSSFETDVEGQRRSCWAATVLDKPLSGAFGIIGQGAIDGPPTLAIFLQVIGGTDFGPEEGMVPLTVRVDGDTWDLDAKHLPVENEPRLVLVDPPVSLYSALRKGSRATFNAPGGVDDLDVSLIGSRKAIGEFEECLVRLIPSASNRGEPPASADTSVNEWGVAEPSFSCRAATAPVEEMICKDAALAAMDAELAPIFAKAKARAAGWQFSADGGQSALEWFTKNARDDLAWRNGNCEGRRDCVEAWFVKRKAMMLFLANSDEGFGDGGVDTVRQLENTDTLIAVRMATHKRNVLFDASDEDFEVLPDGDIKIVSHDPFFYRVDNQKGYWAAGGSFWYSSIRDSRHRIIEIPAPESDATCMSRSEFLKKSNITATTLSLVAENRICVKS